MKAISIRQPWAWLIVRPDLEGDERSRAAEYGMLKDIENRTWPTRYRGEILIHAARGMTRDEYTLVQELLYGSSIQLPSMPDLARGGIVGVATLADCVPPQDRQSNWHMHGQFGFLLQKVRPLPFTPCKGALGIFEVQNSDLELALGEFHA